MNIHEWKLATKQKNTINIYEWKLTTKQKKAIDKTKKLFGEYWKEEIKKGWRTGVYSWGLDNNEIATLQRMRNTIGNKGLDALK